MTRTTDLRGASLLCLVCMTISWLAFSCIREQEAYAGEGKSRTREVIAGWPVHVTDAGENAAVREERLTAIARAIDLATSDMTERAALLTLVRNESGAAAYVYEGRCSDGPRGQRECDSGRATGVWQIHGEVPDSVVEQAELALSIWRSHRTRCRKVLADELVGAFAGYGTGGKCAPEAWAVRRAEETRRVARRLW